MNLQFPLFPNISTTHHQLVKEGEEPVKNLGLPTIPYYAYPVFLQAQHEILSDSYLAVHAASPSPPRRQGNASVALSGLMESPGLMLVAWVSGFLAS